MNFTIMISILYFSFSILEYDIDAFGEEHNIPQLVNPEFKIEIIATGLDYPTQMTFVDDDTILVAQKNNGKIIEIKNFEIYKEILDLNVDSYQTRGLVGLNSVNYQGNVFVFVYFTESKVNYDFTLGKNKELFWDSSNMNNGNKLYRFKWNGHSLVEPTLLLHPLPWSAGTHHGGATAIHKGNLFLIVGDNTNEGYLSNFPNSQEYDKAVIYRINFNGEGSDLNPFLEEPFSKYYAYGIRNSFGLAIDPLTERLWETENGPDEYDEVNLVLPGFNSGWKKILGPNGESSYSADINQLVNLEGSHYSDPEFSWKTTIAPTAIEFLKSKKYGDEYLHDVFIGDVQGNLYHFELNENRDGFIFKDNVLLDLVADTPEEANSIIFGKNLGLITDIKTGPDGYLYVVSLYQNFEGMEGYKKPRINPQFIQKASNLGTIFRIVPSSSSPDEKIMDSNQFDDVESSSVIIPDWISNNAKWWSEGKISDSDFISGIEFMIKENIISIPNLPEKASETGESVPDWIRNNAGWWSEGKITDYDFVQGIQYLVKEGIIKVN